MKKKKYYRTPKAKDNELLVKYGQEYGENDLYYCWPENTVGMKRDSNLVMAAFERLSIYGEGTLREQLEQRGYDITTLKFSIKKKMREK